MTNFSTVERQWTIAEIATHQGVAVSTVRRWTRRRRNRLRVVKFGHRTVRVLDSALAVFLAGHVV